MTSRSALRTLFPAGRFRAIARTADSTHFEFVWSVEVFEAALEFDSGGNGILHAEAAKVCAHAGLYHADAFGVGLPGGHAEIGPDIW